jgi:hypothetical protein
VVEHPRHDRRTIVGEGGCLVLGSKPIVDRHRDAAGTGGQITTHPLIVLRAADHPTPAVDPHQDGERPLAQRRRDDRAHPGDLALGLGRDLGTVAAERRQQIHPRSRHLDALLV